MVGSFHRYVLSYNGEFITIRNYDPIEAEGYWFRSQTDSSCSQCSSPLAEKRY